MIKRDGDCSDHGVAQPSGRVDVKRSLGSVVYIRADDYNFGPGLRGPNRIGAQE
jgi:hypothetical protein